MRKQPTRSPRPARSGTLRLACLRLCLALGLGQVALFGVARADEPVEGTYSIDPAASSISYQVVHKLHKIDGTSRRAEGKARVLSDGKVQVMVRAPVESFDSGNANRDAHMKEVVEAARYPTVELKAVAEPHKGPTRTLLGQVTFHGVTLPLSVPVTVTTEGSGKLRARAQFDLSLDAAKIERPSLMFVKVEDALHVRADLVLTR
jgi:polyisoprenoid-binding protein YceI